MRRHAIRGLKSKQMLTDLLIAVIPDGLPRDGTAVDVLVHLHGHEVWGENKDKTSASRFRDRVRGRPRPRRRAAHRPRRDAARGADVGGRQTADRPAAARVRQVGLQPGRRLGLRPRQLREGRVRAADGRRGVGRRRRPGGRAAHARAGHALRAQRRRPADHADVEWWPGGRSGRPLPLRHDVRERRREEARSPRQPTPANWPLKLEGKVEAYVKARFDADLAAVRAAPAADRRAWVERRGFRLSVVHAQGSPRYAESSERLRSVVEGWIAALDPAVVGADAIAAIRRNYVFKTAAKGKSHMQVMGDGNFAGAIRDAPAVGGHRCEAGPAGERHGGATGGRAAPGRGQPGDGRRARAAGRRARPAPSPSSATRPPSTTTPSSPPSAPEARSRASWRATRTSARSSSTTFGSITRANAYYAGVKRVEFLGRKPTVHESTLGEKLRKAEQVLTDKGWRDEAAAALGNAGGFNIRRNRNARSKLSDHSFGWAVDLDASLNPNLSKRFPGRALMAATGTDIVTDAMTTVAAGGSTADLLAPIEEIRAASEAFKDAFRDEASLERAMRAHVVTRMKFRIAYDVVLAGDGQVGRRVGEGGQQGASRAGDAPQGEPGAAFPTPSSGSRQPTASRSSPTRAGRRGRRRRPSATRPSNGSGRRSASAAPTPSPRPSGCAKQASRTPTSTSSSTSRCRKPRSPRSTPSSGSSPSEPPAPSSRCGTSSAARSYAGKPGANRVPAETEGTPSTVAAHGFMNMPSKLAAALAGSDGGDLDWLGVGSVRDLMHFQLKSGDRPSLR